MKKVLFFVVAVMLLIVMVSMSSVGQVYGQQEPTLMWTIPPPPSDFYWTPDPNNPCPSCVVLICDENNVFCATATPYTYIMSPYPMSTEEYLEPYPIPIVETGDDEVETVTRMYASAATPVWIETEYCVKFVTHSICRR